MSTTEAELVALADCAIELLYIKTLLEFIGFEITGAILVETDSKGAHDLCHRFTSAQHTRHIDRKLFKMRELRGARLVEVKHLGTDENSADMFTKVLTRQPFEKHRKYVMNLGVSVGNVHSSSSATSTVSGLADCDAREPFGAMPDVGSEDMFDDKYDGFFFFVHAVTSFLIIASVAKAKTSPDIYGEREMRGPEWDEAKMVEVDTLRKMGAFLEIAADDPKIKGWRVVDTMWTGRVKRKADRTVDKRKGRAVLRGDLHKLHYGVDANQATAPVVRSSSMSAIDCISALRRQHMVSFDCPSAYLQGQQQPSEQVLARPPPGFRTFDERGVAILWLMQNPLYGQLDAGAIWNRTFNEFVTRQGPPATSGTSSSYAAEIEAVQA